jgi:hypothetical protein
LRRLHEHPGKRDTDLLVQDLSRDEVAFLKVDILRRRARIALVQADRRSVATAYDNVESTADGQAPRT